MLDLERFVAGIHDYIARALKPLAERIKELDEKWQKQADDSFNEELKRFMRGEPTTLKFEPLIPAPKDGLDGKDGIDGKSVVPEDVMPALLARLDESIKSLPVPKDGRDGSDGKDGVDGKSVLFEDVFPKLSQQVQKHLDSIPVPKDGRDGTNGKDGTDGRDGIDGKDGLDGKDGTSVRVEDVLPALKTEVTELIKAIPVPRNGTDGKDGTSVRVEDVMPALRAELSAAIKAMPVPQDGKSVSLEDVRKMWSDMYTAQQAIWALDFERRGQDVLQRCIDRIEKPKDGRDGKDGRDALDLEHFDIQMQDDERTIVVSLARGEKSSTKQIVLSHPIYRGIWRESEYRKGDCVTFGGSSFIALRDTRAKPETDDSWRLFVKRGRDGKDFEPKRPSNAGSR